MTDKELKILLIFGIVLFSLILLVLTAVLVRNALQRRKSVQTVGFLNGRQTDQVAVRLPVQKKPSFNLNSALSVITF